MKKFFYVILLIAGVLVFNDNRAFAVENENSSSVSVVSQSGEDDYLGTVNLCDPNGNICYVGKAYQDSSNGRIYVKYSYQKYYSQKSNNSSWDYMIRMDGKWYYFSF